MPDHEALETFELTESNGKTTIATIIFTEWKPA